MIIFTIENTDGLHEIELRYEGREPITVTIPTQTDSVYIGSDGNPIPNGVPVVINIKKEQTDPSTDIPIIIKEEQDIREEAFRLCWEDKKKRRGIKPYVIARKAVERILPELCGISRKQLLDRIRHAIMIKFNNHRRRSDGSAYADMFRGKI